MAEAGGVEPPGSLPGPAFKAGCPPLGASFQNAEGAGLEPAQRSHAVHRFQRCPSTSRSPSMSGETGTRTPDTWWCYTLSRRAPRPAGLSPWSGWPDSNRRPACRLRVGSVSRTRRADQAALQPGRDGRSRTCRIRAPSSARYRCATSRCVPSARLERASSWFVAKCSIH
jgi:hypothetical protein